MFCATWVHTWLLPRIKEFSPFGSPTAGLPPSISVLTWCVEFLMQIFSRFLMYHAVYNINAQPINKREKIPSLHSFNYYSLPNQVFKLFCWFKLFIIFSMTSQIPYSSFTKQIELHQWPCPTFNGDLDLLWASSLFLLTTISKPLLWIVLRLINKLF